MKGGIIVRLCAHSASLGTNGVDMGAHSADLGTNNIDESVYLFPHGIPDQLHPNTEGRPNTGSHLNAKSYLIVLVKSFYN